MAKKIQHWLYNPSFEVTFIMLPAWLPVVIVFLFSHYFTTHTVVTSFWWVVLVLLVDVAHVYSTVFKFFWERETFEKFKTHLLIIPVVGVIGGIALHQSSPLLFWRILAYLAVFHFIRQQYGFMRIYSRKEAFNKTYRFIDAVTIYAATLYPLLYWHLHLTHDLNWFVEGDFISLHNAGIESILDPLYIIILTIYLIKEAVIYFSQRTFNIPKNLIVIGTIISWYAGIIIFHGDLAFTMLNVLAHGIPYMALIWITTDKEQRSKPAFTINVKRILVFVSVILLLAYFEEGIWDIFVWKDHPSVFPLLTNLPAITNPLLLSILVPILTLPQFTHYILDGFLWRTKRVQAA